MTGQDLVQDCTHPRAQHRHGTATAYKRDRCRCLPCTAAQLREDRSRRLANHLGQPRRIDGERVREHILALRDRGIGYRTVAKLAGVSASTIERIMTPPPSRRRANGSTVVTRVVAKRILSVALTPELLAAVPDGASVDATGTRRRLHALHAIGWSRRELARRLGVQHNSLRHMELTGRTSAGLARSVQALYDELWDATPPTGTSRERVAVEAARAWARREGWVPPMAWDDDEIDNPAATPAAVTGPHRISPTERLDEVAWLLECGTDRETAARRGGYASWANAHSVAARHGHALAAPAASTGRTAA